MTARIVDGVVAATYALRFMLIRFDTELLRDWYKMEFSEFAQILAPYAKGSDSEATYTSRLFEAIVDDNVPDSQPPYTSSSSAMRSYYNGTRSIGGIAKSISQNLDPEKFAVYIGSLNPLALARLAEALQPYVGEVTLRAFPHECAGLFADIIYDAVNTRPGPKTSRTYNREDTEVALVRIISTLSALDEVGNLPRLHMNAVKVKKKAASCSAPLVKDMTEHVAQYYNFIAEQMGLMEAAGQLNAKKLALQVQLQYETLTESNLSQEQIFYAVRDWIKAKSNTDHEYACNIMTAFFVQNCEVFDAPSK